MPEQQYYSVEQVAELLGLHVKTVRGYVRDGRLGASQVGRQYRISRADLAAFTGTPAPPAQAGHHAEVSSIVQIDGVDTPAAARLTNTVAAAALSASTGEGGRRLRVEAVHDEERATLKLIVLGDLESTADLLHIIHSLVDRPT
ncbi:MerR family transcriptional regulator [Kitasatospora sp. MMS16-BH015]|uniref:helix-turn-helix domain-containing protein n=1 Tax=Kitasatospora sp. MMS16-BH015 TaxID=2018025 RepID=UPI000CA1CCC9|nr:helix-turn-helix domain-containing protein [Kitasatospora sp. MMS16-BH015]AUG81363.1 MerR family transcriptional regulator [Kitasatospora sp. MMS16-BH015]